MRVMLPALTLLLAACGGADKASDAAGSAGDSAEVKAEAAMPAGELAQLENAISDTTVAEVVADDPGGRLADGPDVPAMADPLASPMPEAPVEAVQSGVPAPGTPAPAGK
ncbi:hypothetical protein [Thermaurantiacus sp.]